MSSIQFVPHLVYVLLNIQPALLRLCDSAKFVEEAAETSVAS